MPNESRYLTYLLIVRWAALLHVALLYLVGIDVGSPLVFVFLAGYNALLAYFWDGLTKTVAQRPVLLQLDLFIAALVLWATGGSWKSAYYVYVFTCLMAPPFFLTVRGSLLSSIGFCVLYTFGLAANEGTIARVALDGDYDTLVSNYVAFLLTAVFFGYPAHLIRHIITTTQEAVYAEEYLDTTNKLLAVARASVVLSPREMEVLVLLCEGKTNAKIAKDLHISERTVKNHLYRAYKKLGVSSRSEALLYCLGEFHLNHDGRR